MSVTPSARASAPNQRYGAATMLARLALLAAVAAAPLAAQPATATASFDRDVFESQVRPVLAQRCYGCHGPKTQKADLRLDHGALLRRGGARGPAIDAEHPANSRLLHAIGYADVDLQMPPKGKLPANELDALTRWVEQGAPWPDEPIPGAERSAPKFDLAARRAAHWCWQPMAASLPPDVRDPSWPRDAVDLFVLAELEAHDLAPAPEAERTTWLRRVTFDLHGLPPTRAELVEFLADASPGAHARVVDRLLASPHFGERWARHWLDLVRYAETLGHEFDYAIPEAWRYRDYVVRAFNQDVPYDRFVQEHLAGDQLPTPRLHPDGYDESPLGTCSFWFGDQVHSPVDVRKHQADRVDNQLDVLSKTFLGLTVSCARCHDHKFDAIAQRDYYALAGVLKDSRYALTPLLPPGGHRDAQAALAELRPRLVAEIGARWLAQAARLADYLSAVAELAEVPRRRDGEAQADFELRQQSDDLALARVAHARNLELARLRTWRDLARRPHGDRRHPLQAFASYLNAPAEWPARARALTADRAERAPLGDAIVLADFRTDDFAGWVTVGEAFGHAPRARDLVAVDQEGRAVVRFWPGRMAQSAGDSPRLQGSLLSRNFRIDRRFLWVKVAGERCRINVVVEGFNVIRDPIYGGLRRGVDEAAPTWLRFDVGAWRGSIAYLQLQDLRTGDPGDESDRSAPGFIALQQALLTDSDAAPEVDPLPAAVTLLGPTLPQGAEALAHAYAAATERALARWMERGADGSLDEVEARWLNFLARHRLLDDATASPLRQLVRGVDAAIAEVPSIPALRDGEGLDEHLYVRGEHRQLGPLVPRAGLTALGSDPAAYRQGSGRLALARELTAPDHPLVARVFVNRAWQHLFGAGLVPTSDNFGALGEPPSHPALLDALARDFVADGWSLKRLLRRLTLTSTYRMASAHPDPRAATIDGTLRLMHRARVRRLDGETLRDALLALAGRLDRRLGGPSVAVHLTPFMDGRGRPGHSGPLDGAGRRSVYQEVRRNFLNPLFLAFDTPIPFATVGRRNVSNVPAQSLALMNDPLVHELSKAFAERALRDKDGEPRARVAAMLQDAWQRPPRHGEVDAAHAFVREQAAAHRTELDALPPWADLAHALVNAKDFLFVR
jgi:cytochrome c553